MASPAKDRKSAPLPAPNSDFYELLETLPAEELAVVKQVRTFMETKIAPHHHEVLGRRCIPIRNLARVERTQLARGRLRRSLRRSYLHVALDRPFVSVG
jgi:hypothetical protein